MTRPLFIALAAAFALSTTPALAADHGERHAARVTYADLDTSRTAGADALSMRIHAAASRVCNDRTGPMTLRERMEIRSCMREVSSDAHAQVASRHHAPQRLAMASR